MAALLQRVAEEQGRLDLLVNAVWGGNELRGLQRDWARPSWELPAAEYWDKMFEAGLRPALTGESRLLNGDSRERRVRWERGV